MSSAVLQVSLQVSSAVLQVSLSILQVSSALWVSLVFAGVSEQGTF